MKNKKTKKKIVIKDKKILNILRWAAAVKDSIIAGTYNIPKEMTYSINNLQDAVSEVRYYYDNYPELPPEYIKFRDEQHRLREEAVLKLAHQI